VPPADDEVSAGGAALAPRSRFKEDLFLYVGNNPVNRIDPEGLQAIVVHGTPAAAGKGKTCPERVFDEEFAAAMARKKGWKFAHCMSACRARTECKLPAKAVWFLGMLNEARQVAECKAPPWLGGDPDACHSAWAQADFNTNEVGFSCPGESCYKRCSPFWNQDKQPSEYGPFFKGARGE
jgi:hypothetical protein